MDKIIKKHSDFSLLGSVLPGKQYPTPRPSLGEEAYQSELESCLSADPRRRQNYDNYLLAQHGATAPNYLPIKLDVENVSRCNFRCTMCVVSDWHKGKRGEDLSLDAFKQLIDEQYGLVELKIQGLGEPTLQGDALIEMIRYARDRHIWVRTVTNGSRLHVNQFYKNYVDTDVNEIQVSIDGATKNVFESIRRQSNFSQVIENCRTLNDYCRQKGRRITKMWSLVQEANRHQLLDLVELAADLGFQDLAFSFTLIGWGDTEWHQRNQRVQTQDRYDVDLMQHIYERSNQLGIRVGFWLCNAKYSTKSAQTRCPWPFERSMISSDSRVVPCCTISNPDSFEITDSQSTSLTDLWNSTEYAEFRQAHISGNLPDVCKSCYVDGD